MSTTLQLQDYLFKGMLSCDFFDMFNIVLERQFLMQSELEWNAIWQTQRAGPDGKPTDAARVGAGYYIEIPKLEVPRPNSRQRFLTASVVSIEERNLNMTPEVGTLMNAEDMAELALDFMFGWVLNISSALVPENAAILPARDLQLGDGMVVYRTSVTLRVEKVPPPRCDQPQIIAGAGVWTIQNGGNTPDATIYYTLDNSFPGRVNPVANVFAGPITVAAGTIINAMAWRQDRLPSHLSQILTS